MRFGIIGGGIIGITCAYYLAQLGHSVVLIEKEKELGGFSGSFLLSGGFLEKYYHYVIKSDEDILQLIDRLSLSSELIWTDIKRGLFSRSVYPFNNNRDIFGIETLNLIDKIRFYMSMASLRHIKDLKSLEGINAEKWLRSSGGSGLFRFFWTPLLKNRFGNDYNQLGAVYLWSNYRNIHGKIGYLMGGFQRIFEVMREKISGKGGTIKTSTTVKNISVTHDGTIRVSTEKDFLNFDRVIVTVPLPSFMKMVKDLPVEYAMNLNEIKYMNVLSVILELNRSFSDNYIIQSCDLSYPFSEIVEHTRLFPSDYFDGSHMVYILKYIEQGNVYMNYSIQKLLDDYIPFLKRICPAFEREWIKKHYVFRLDYAYPVITCNYPRIIPDIVSPVRGVYLATRAQIYPGEININSSICLANKVIESFISEGNSK
jgi:protoporphyrinogen oxidase